MRELSWKITVPFRRTGGGGRELGKIMQNGKARPSFQIGKCPCRSDWLDCENGGTLCLQSETGNSNCCGTCTVILWSASRFISILGAPGAASRDDGIFGRKLKEFTTIAEELSRCTAVNFRPKIRSTRLAAPGSPRIAYLIIRASSGAVFKSSRTASATHICFTVVKCYPL